MKKRINFAMNNNRKKITVIVVIAVAVALSLLFNLYFSDKDTQTLANQPKVPVQTDSPEPQIRDTPLSLPAEEPTVTPLPETKPETFLEKNSRDRLVNTLSSGIQFKVIDPGSGKYPMYDDTVRVMSQLTVLDASGQEREKLNEAQIRVDLGTLPDILTEAISQIGEGGVGLFYAPWYMASLVPKSVLGPVNIKKQDTLVLKITLKEIKSK